MTLLQHSLSKIAENYKVNNIHRVEMHKIIFYVRKTEVVRLREENNETVVKMSKQFKQELEQVNQIQQQHTQNYFKNSEDKLNKQKETDKMKLTM